MCMLELIRSQYVESKRQKNKHLNYSMSHERQIWGCRDRAESLARWQVGHGRSTKDVAAEPGLGRPTGMQMCMTVLPPDHWCLNGLPWVLVLTNIFRNSISHLLNTPMMKKKKNNHWSKIVVGTICKVYKKVKRACLLTPKFFSVVCIQEKRRARTKILVFPSS